MTPRRHGDLAHCRGGGHYRLTKVGPLQARDTSTPAGHPARHGQSACVKVAHHHRDLAARRGGSGHARLTVVIGAPAAHRTRCRQCTRVVLPRRHCDLPLRRGCRHDRLAGVAPAPAAHPARRRQGARVKEPRRHCDLAARRSSRGHARLAPLVYAPAGHPARRRQGTRVVVPRRHGSLAPRRSGRGHSRLTVMRPTAAVMIAHAPAADTARRR
jgi:hypothetical protein